MRSSYKKGKKYPTGYPHILYLSVDTWIYHPALWGGEVGSPGRGNSNNVSRQGEWEAITPLLTSAVTSQELILCITPLPNNKKYRASSFIAFLMKFRDNRVVIVILLGSLFGLPAICFLINSLRFTTTRMFIILVEMRFCAEG